MAGATKTGAVRLFFLAVTAAVGANTDTSVGDSDANAAVKPLHSDLDQKLIIDEYASVGGMALKPSDIEVTERRKAKEILQKKNTARMSNDRSGRKKKKSRNRRRSERLLFQSAIAADFVENSASDSTLVVRSGSWNTGWYDPWHGTWTPGSSTGWYEGRSKSAKLTKSNSLGADDWYDDGWAVDPWHYGDDWLGSGKSGKTGTTDDWSQSDPWHGDDWFGWSGIPGNDDWSNPGKGGDWLGSGKSGKTGTTDDWSQPWTGDDYWTGDDWSEPWVGDDYHNNGWDKGWGNDNSWENIWRKRKNRDWNNDKKRKDSNGNGWSKGSDWGSWGKDRDRNNGWGNNNGWGKNNGGGNNNGKWGGKWNDWWTASPTFSPTLSPTFYPTFYPTLSPTYTPTSSPTWTPTFSPTFYPTITDPTFSPTYSPTSYPTISPTYSPTELPTGTPTMEPTFEPTTFEPTINPTYTPTTCPDDAQRECCESGSRSRCSSLNCNLNACQCTFSFAKNLCCDSDLTGNQQGRCLASLDCPIEKCKQIDKLK